jgi:hypothetical protein
MSAKVSLDQVKELLGFGLPNDQVAAAVGCDQSYISQLLSDENFAKEIVVLRIQNLTAASDRDRKWDKIEDTAIQKLVDYMEQGFHMKVPDLLRIATFSNRAVRRGVSSGNMTPAVTQNIVQLNLSRVAVSNFTISTQGEVVEVDGQTLVTMSSNQLLEKLSKERKDSGVNYNSVQKYLPVARTGG